MKKIKNYKILNLEILISNFDTYHICKLVIEKMCNLSKEIEKGHIELQDEMDYYAYLYETFYKYEKIFKKN